MGEGGSKYDEAVRRVARCRARCFEHAGASEAFNKSARTQSFSHPHTRLLKSTTPVLQCSHARSASTVVTRPWWAALTRPWTRYARRDFARKMGFSGANGPHRKPPLRGGMLRMSWRYAPWSTRLVRFEKPVSTVLQGKVRLYVPRADGKLGCALESRRALSETVHTARRPSLVRRPARPAGSRLDCGLI